VHGKIKRIRELIIYGQLNSTQLNSTQPTSLFLENPKEQGTT
jgi:hypothetical protein